MAMNVMMTEYQGKYLTSLIPTTMKQLLSMREGLVTGLRALYEIETKLSLSVDTMIKSTDLLTVKVELVVYVVSLRRNIKAIQQIFSLLDEDLIAPATHSSTSFFPSSLLMRHSNRIDPGSTRFTTPMEYIIDHKMSLYTRAHSLAVELGQHEIASILYGIHQFESETQVIFNEVLGSEAPVLYAVR